MKNNIVDNMDNQPKVVFTYGGDNPYDTSEVALISMSQDSDKLFTVSYGLEIINHLTYSRAAKTLGEAIMHHLSCESIIDNSGA